MVNFTVCKLKNNKSNNIKVKKKITKYLRGNGQDHLGFNRLGLLCDSVSSSYKILMFLVTPYEIV